MAFTAQHYFPVKFSGWQAPAPFADRIFFPAAGWRIFPMDTILNENP